jgi:cleavage and polyadenylation specificity factor subunit 1
LFIDLGLSQIFPIIDEETDAELTVVHSSFCDPYLLLLREDSSLQILQVDKSGDLDELERGDAALSSKWLSGSIYKSEKTGDKALAFLLTADGGLAVSLGSCLQVDTFH